MQAAIRQDVERRPRSRGSRDDDEGRDRRHRAVSSQDRTCVERAGEAEAAGPRRPGLSRRPARRGQPSRPGNAARTTPAAKSARSGRRRQAGESALQALADAHGMHHLRAPSADVPIIQSAPGFRAISTTTGFRRSRASSCISARTRSTCTVDDHCPDRWREEPYFSKLARMVAERHQDESETAAMRPSSSPARSGSCCSGAASFPSRRCSAPRFLLLNGGKLPITGERYRRSIYSGCTTTSPSSSGSGMNSAPGRSPSEDDDPQRRPIGRRFYGCRVTSESASSTRPSTLYRQTSDRSRTPGAIESDRPSMLVVAGRLTWYHATCENASFIASRLRSSMSRRPWRSAISSTMICVSASAKLALNWRAKKNPRRFPAGGLCQSSDRTYQLR